MTVIAGLLAARSGLLLRPLGLLVVGAFVLGMAWSRTALHAHWLTDVLGGLVVGAATALLLHALWSQVIVGRAARTRVR